MDLIKQCLKDLFIEKNVDISNPFLGWNYALNYDSQYFSNIRNNRKKKNYEYKYEPRGLKSELLELEKRNKSTNLNIKPMQDSKIAIFGCGPIGMATALWLNKLYPNNDISIYETRIDLTSKQLKPFSRRWLTSIKLDLLEPILEQKDLKILQQIGLNNYIGIDIRNLEYSLLRAINKKGISICQLKKDIPKPEIIIDATGGKLRPQNQSGIKEKIIMNRFHSKHKNIYGQKIIPQDKFNKFELVNFGNIIKPFHNDYPFQIPYLKINYLPTHLKKDFIYFSNELNNDYGVYYWNGLMRNDLNHSLLILSLFQEEFEAIDDLINFPIRLDQAWDEKKFRVNTSKRLSILFEWLLSSLEESNMCYLEPLFLWQPFLCLRNKSAIVDDILFFNVGDSHYIGNPKIANGLTFHLKELKEIFSSKCFN